MADTAPLASPPSLDQEDPDKDPKNTSLAPEVTEDEETVEEGTESAGVELPRPPIKEYSKWIEDDKLPIEAFEGLNQKEQEVAADLSSKKRYLDYWRNELLERGEYNGRETETKLIADFNEAIKSSTITLGEGEEFDDEKVNAAAEAASVFADVDSAGNRLRLISNLDDTTIQRMDVLSGEGEEAFEYRTKAKAYLDYLGRESKDSDEVQEFYQASINELLDSTDTDALNVASVYSDKIPFAKKVGDDGEVEYFASPLAIENAGGIGPAIAQSIKNGFLSPEDAVQVYQYGEKDEETGLTLAERIRAREINSIIPDAVGSMADDDVISNAMLTYASELPKAYEVLAKVDAEGEESLTESEKFVLESFQRERDDYYEALASTINTSETAPVGFKVNPEDKSFRLLADQYVDQYSQANDEKTFITEGDNFSGNIKKNPLTGDKYIHQAALYRPDIFEKSMADAKLTDEEQSALRKQRDIFLDVVRVAGLDLMTTEDGQSWEEYLEERGGRQEIYDNYRDELWEKRNEKISSGELTVDQAASYYPDTEAPSYGSVVSDFLEKAKPDESFIYGLGFLEEYAFSPVHYVTSVPLLAGKLPVVGDAIKGSGVYEAAEEQSMRLVRDNIKKMESMRKLGHVPDWKYDLTVGAGGLIGQISSDYIFTFGVGGVAKLGSAAVGKKAGLTGAKKSALAKVTKQLADKVNLTKVFKAKGADKRKAFKEAISDAKGKFPGRKLSDVSGVGFRAALATYSRNHAAAMVQVQDNPKTAGLPLERQREIAEDIADFKTVIEVGLTSVFSFLQMDAVENIVLKGASNRQVKKSIARLGGKDRITNKQFANIVGKGMREVEKELGLARNGLTKVIVEGTSEAIEEGAPQTAGVIFEDFMLNYLEYDPKAENEPMLDTWGKFLKFSQYVAEGNIDSELALEALKSGGYDAFIGGTLGTSVSGLRSIAGRVAPSRTRETAEAARAAQTALAERLSDRLSENGAPVTAEVIRNFLKTPARGQTFDGLTRAEVEAKLAAGTLTQEEAVRMGLARPAAEPTPDAAAEPTPEAAAEPTPEAAAEEAQPTTETAVETPQGITVTQEEDGTFTVEVQTLQMFDNGGTDIRVSASGKNKITGFASREEAIQKAKESRRNSVEVAQREAAKLRDAEAGRGNKERSEAFDKAYQKITEVLERNKKPAEPTPEAAAEPAAEPPTPTPVSETDDAPAVTPEARVEEDLTDSEADEIIRGAQDAAFEGEDPTILNTPKVAPDPKLDPTTADHETDKAAAGTTSANLIPKQLDEAKTDKGKTQSATVADEIRNARAEGARVVFVDDLNEADATLKKARGGKGISEDTKKKYKNADSFNTVVDGTPVTFIFESKTQNKTAGALRGIAKRAARHAAIVKAAGRDPVVLPSEATSKKAARKKTRYNSMSDTEKVLTIIELLGGPDGIQLDSKEDAAFIKYVRELAGKLQDSNTIEGEMLASSIMDKGFKPILPPASERSTPNLESRIRNGRPVRRFNKQKIEDIANTLGNRKESFLRFVSALERALNSVPADIPVRLITGKDTGYARVNGGVIEINLGEWFGLYNTSIDIDLAVRSDFKKATAHMDRVIDEEGRHIASFRSIPQALFDKVVDGMSDADFQYILDTYYGFDPVARKKVENILKTGTPAQVKQQKDNLVEEFLRQAGQERTGGFTTEEAMNLLQGKGEQQRNFRQMVMEYLKGLYRRITNKTKMGRILSGPERAALARIQNELSFMQSDYADPMPYGYRSSADPTGLAADTAALEQFAGAPQVRSVVTPEQAERHAELEEKFKAGTITEEETAEAQAIVDEAARAAGYVAVVRSFPDGITPPPASVDTWVSEDTEAGRSYQIEYAGENWRDNSERLFVSEEGLMDMETGWDRGQTMQITEGASIKSADPFTGTPIRERFDPTQESILYAPSYGIVDAVNDINAGNTDTPLRSLNKVVEEAQELRDRQQKEAKRRAKPRRRGKAAIMERVSRARAAGEIQEETAQAITQFVNSVKDEAIGDTAISIRKEGTSNYDFTDNLISFFLTQDTGDFGASTAIHEFWHGLSRFLPDAEANKIKKRYFKELNAYVEKNPWYYAFVGRKSLSPRQFDEYKTLNPEEAATKLTPVYDEAGDIVRYDIKFDKENYRYSMLDEFIAETMADLVTRKQKAPDTFLGQMAKVIREFLDLIKAKLGRDPFERFYQSVTNPLFGLEKIRQSPVAPPSPVYEPTNYRSQRFGDSESILYAPPISSKQDADYLAAVEAGDIDVIQQMVNDAAGLKPREIFYLGDVEVIRNPTMKDQGQMSREVRSEFPNDTLGTRFTYDSKGNRYIWKAYEGIHSDIEPKIQAREGSPLSQNAVKDETVTLPIVYDKKGNVIPLSQRFDEQKESILYAPPISNRDARDDADYMDAIDRGDYDMAEEVINKVAERYGVTEPDLIFRDNDGNIMTPSQRFMTPPSVLTPEKIARHKELEAKYNAGTLTPEEEQEAGRIVEEAARGAGGKKLFRITDKSGVGLMNNSAIDRSRLTDSAEQELVELMDFGLEQPRGVASGNVFFFTEEGIERHAKLVRLLKIAAGVGNFIRTENYLFGDPEWESNDGQVAASPSQIKSADPFTGVPIDERFDPGSESILYTPRFVDVKGGDDVNTDVEIDINGLLQTLNVPAYHTNKLDLGNAVKRAVITGRLSDERVRNMIISINRFQKVIPGYMKAYEERMKTAIKRLNKGKDGLLDEDLRADFNTAIGTEDIIVSDEKRTEIQEILDEDLETIRKDSDRFREPKEGELKKIEDSIAAKNPDVTPEELAVLVGIEFKNKLFKEARDKATQSKVNLFKEAAEAKKVEVAAALARLEKSAPELAQLVIDVRQAITDISQFAMESGIPMSDELRMVFDATQGFYLSRKYRFFNDPAYRSALLEEAAVGAKPGDFQKKIEEALPLFEELLRSQTRKKLFEKEARKQLSEGNITASQLRDDPEIRKKIKEAVESQIDQEIGDVDKASRAALLDYLESYGDRREQQYTEHGVRIVDSILKNKENIPEPIRNLLGQYKSEEDMLDGFRVMLQTVGNQTAMLASAMKLQNLKTINDEIPDVKNKFILTDEQYIAGREDGSIKPGEFSEWDKKTGSMSKADPLKGMYVQTDLADALLAKDNKFNYDTATQTERGLHVVGGVVGFLTGMSMMAVTGFSGAAYYLRNSIGNLFRAINSGQFTDPRFLGSFLVRSMAEGVAAVPFVSPKVRYVPDKIARLLNGESVSLESLMADHYKLQSLSVIDQSVTAASLRDIFNPSKQNPTEFYAKLEQLDQSSRVDRLTRKSVSNFFDYIQKLQNSTDNAYKLSTYYRNKRLLEKAKEEGSGSFRGVDLSSMSSYDIEREAALMMNKVTPGEDYLIQAGEYITQSWLRYIAGPFTRFRSEVLRTYTNMFRESYRLLASQNPVFKEEGGRRVVGLLALHTISFGPATFLLSKLLGGFGQEEQDVLDEANPSFFSLAQLIRMRDGDVVTDINFTYMNEMALLGDSFSFAMQKMRGGESAMESALGATSVFVMHEVLGEQILAGTLQDLRDNTDSYTQNNIYRRTDDAFEKLEKSMQYIFKRVRPATIRGITEAMDAYEVADGEKESKMDVATKAFLGRAVFPTKPFSDTLQNKLNNTLRKYSNDKRDILSDQSRLAQEFKSGVEVRRPTQAKLDELADGLVKDMTRIFDDVDMVVRGYQKMQVSEEDITKALNESFNMSKSEIGYYLRTGNFVLPYFSKGQEKKLNAFEDQDDAKARVEAFKKALRKYSTPDTGNIRIYTPRKTNK